MNWVDLVFSVFIAAFIALAAVGLVTASAKVWRWFWTDFIKGSVIFFYTVEQQERDFQTVIWILAFAFSLAAIILHL